MQYETTDWSNEGRADCVVTSEPEVVRPGLSSIWPNGRRLILIADCSDTDDPEGNARMIADALNGAFKC